MCEAEFLAWIQPKLTTIPSTINYAVGLRFCNVGPADVDYTATHDVCVFSEEAAKSIRSCTAVTRNTTVLASYEGIISTKAIAHTTSFLNDP
eukprot:4069690-Amphidinium_carterae.1